MKLSFVLLLICLTPCYLAAQATFETQTVHSTEVFFDFGQAVIRLEAGYKLTELNEISTKEQPIFVKITAHTDSIGSVSNNLRLSQKRAEAIKNYLLAEEITADSIIINLFGESKPIASNKTDRGRQQNRRATVEVLKLREMIVLSGTIIDQETEQGIPATISIRSKEYDQTLDTDENGNFNAVAPLGAVIGIDVTAKGYFLSSKMLKATPEVLSEDFQIQLPRIEKGKAFDLENLYFVGGRDILLKSSEPELPKILKFMQFNDSIKIEIAGHVNVPNANPVAESSKNYELSVMRALVVYNYLLRNGISEDRISYQGYGNWKMRFPNAQTESQQSANRRVEIKVLETEMSKPSNNSSSKADTTTGSN